ncbi:N-acetylmuramoyl-L-alanine amidase [Caenispirillum salinarum AK4]|uniref:N-acetylmuramoyl-L-alanine amidase n=1 Tax=Caenispirillum salinarum AK4 TaxID=1238182 RepID=K9GXI5_9PROT|nr:N-acetylmuramoyl-L-alanine amidase [Caenispirillum salinarum]EKV29982.1 N-acetylmuramoyl-L-alanine amidase [Caenispirillum salinarum AK4]
MLKPVRHARSPNHGPREKTQPVDMLVLHYTGMKSAQEALQRLCDEASSVSAHYLIEEDGTVHALVPENRRAWHAGVSSWRGRTDVNSRSIGIELVNPGHEFGYRPFPEPQMTALIALCQAVLARHPIPARNVVGHADVAPLRKEDPGELFDWKRLAAEGIGLWPADVEAFPTEQPPSIAAVQEELTAIGYAAPRSGALDEATAKALTAFQRHFRPADLSGVPDAETWAMLKAVRTAADADRAHQLDG